jgi:hypothetical protein
MQNDITKSISLQTIIDLENLFLTAPQVELPIMHDFIDGVYARSMFIPAGTYLTGAIHSKDCFTVIRYGDIEILTEYGMKQFKAGDMIVSKAGIKRAGHAITDTYITGFMANPDNETDPENLWDLYALPNDAVLIEETE